MDPMEEESFKLAMQLMQEDIAANEKAAAAAVSQSEKEQQGEPLVEDETKKKQEELDLQIAMEIQNAFNAQPPPAPAPTYFPAPTPFGGGSYRPDHSEVAVPPSQEAIKRLIADLREAVNAKDPFIHVHPDQEDITHISALIIGPEGTPYEGGFFHFEMRFPHDYPWRPPKVHLETTDGGNVRFNPNLYACGKVCLSILGTWSGPGWTEIQTIFSTLMSVQSLMNEKPYHNEPGHEVERHPRDVTDYNDCIEHETLRVAIIGMMEEPTTPVFMEIMEESFLRNYDKYLGWIEKRRDKDGKTMRDPFGEQRGMFKYGSFVSRLEKIKQAVLQRREEARLQKERDALKEDEDSSESSDSEGEEEEEDKMVMSTVPTTTTSTTPSASFESGNVPPAHTSTAPEASPAAMDIESSPSPAAAASAAVLEALPAGAAPVGLFGTGAPPQPSMAAAQAGSQSEQSSPWFGGLPGAAAGGPAAEVDSDYLLALQLQAQLDGDADLAQQLQNELNKAGGGGQPTPSVAPTPAPYAPVKPPSLAELMAGGGGGAAGVAQDKENAGSEASYDPAIVCLICKQSPQTYIVLPSCEQPHIYCYSCAEKRAGMPSDRDDDYRYGGFHRRRGGSRYGSAGQSLTCVLCNAVSPLEGHHGLQALKRHRKRKRTPGGSEGWCDEHKEEMCLYCMDDQQLICLLCAGSSHANHTYEALETAQSKLKSRVQSDLTGLNAKWGKLEQFVQEVKTKEGQLAQDVERKRRKAREGFERLRRLLDEKERELDQAITSVHAQKQHALEAKVAKARTLLDRVPATIATVQAVADEQAALPFLLRYEDCEQDVRDISHAPVPAVEQSWFTMPQLKVNQVEYVIKHLKYQDVRGYDPMGGFPGAPEDEEDYDDDDDAHHEEEPQLESDQAIETKQLSSALSSFLASAIPQQPPTQ